jgi:N-acetylmuramoyl-L-alanine amidase
VIAGLLLLLQTAGQPPSPIVVRTANAIDTLVVVAGADGTDRVALTELSRALRATTSAPRPGRTLVRFGESTLELGEGVPYVVAGDSVYPLVAAPVVEGGRLLVPLQVVTDVLPRGVTGWLYDAPARELRAFSTVARRPARDSAATPPGTPRTPVPPAEVRGRHTVVVDAGHGGPDGGMQGTTAGGRTVQEKDVTLAVARELQGALRERGIGVVMTRARDTLIALADRGKIANQRRGDLFISIHVNAANPAWRNSSGARGFETYFLAEAKTEDERRVAQMENESVRFETSTETEKGDPLSFIITDMAQNEHLRESSELASRIQRRLGKVHPGPSRGVKQAGFKVLVTAFMPAVLVEIGYGTNPAEAAYIASAAGQRQIAASIAEAAEEYLADYSRRVERGSGK